MVLAFLPDLRKAGMKLEKTVEHYFLKTNEGESMIERNISTRSSGKQSLDGGQSIIEQAL